MTAGRTRGLSPPNLPPISPLRGLLEVTRLVRTSDDLPELLRAIARVIAESLGYETVAINLYRPAWDDFECTTVHGARRGGGRSRSACVRRIEDWEPLLSDRFSKRGAYFVPAGEFDWSKDGGDFYLPDHAAGVGEDAWHPLDALFVPMRHHDGHLVGILSVDEPLSRMRADRRGARRARRARRPRRARRAVRAGGGRGGAPPSRARAAAHGVDGPDGASRARTRSCSASASASATRSASRTCMVVSTDVETGRLDAARDRRLGASDASSRVTSSSTTSSRCSTPSSRSRAASSCRTPEAEKRISRETLLVRSQRNGRGPRAWDRHWLLVPLHDADERRHRDALGRRARRPAAPVAGEAPGAAHLREPGRRGDRVRRARAASSASSPTTIR